MGNLGRRTAQFAFAAAVLVAGVFVLDRALDPFEGQRFDAATWAAAKPQQRAPMAKDAIHRLPAGTPSATVKEMLGEPQTLPAGGDAWGIKPLHAVTWVYYLGGWSMHGLDAAYLYVHFGPDDRVVKVEIRGG